jgi:two-component system chemotaxis sensor kinase CheA
MKTAHSPQTARGIPGIFKPAVALMKRNKYPYKFAILGFGGAVAILFLLGSLLISLLASVNVAQRELSGLKLINPSLQFIQLVQQHRGLSSAVLAGNDALKDAAAAKELEIKEAIKRVDASLTAENASPKTRENWDNVKKTWTSLAEEWIDLARTANLQSYQELVNLSLKFVYSTGDFSGLATDPSLDSYYLVGMSVYIMPDLIELLATVGDAGADTYVRKSITEDQRAVFAGQSGVIARITGELGLNLDRSASYNEAIKDTLAQFKPEFLNRVTEVTIAIDGDIVTGRLAQQPDFIASKIVKVVDQGYEELFKELLPTTQKLIDERRLKLQKQVYASLGTALVLLAVTVYLFIAAYLSIMGDLGGLSATAKRIAEGDLQARVEVTSKDELAVVGVGFNSMADSIDSLIGKIHEKSQNIAAMLEHIPQGILTVVPGSTIHPEYSTYLKEMFETSDISGMKVMDLVFTHTNLGTDTLDQVDTAIASCIGEDRMNFEFNSHLLVTQLDKEFSNGRIKSMELSWSPICNADDVVEKLMLCVRDVTEVRQLAAAAGQQKRELEIIGEILAVNQEKFHEFIESAREFLAENEPLIQAVQDQPSQRTDAIGQLFRNMHTIKGNARTYGLLHLTNQVHEAEQSYDALRSNADAPWDAPRLQEELARTAAIIEEYAHINEAKLGRKGPGRRAGVEKYLMVQKDHIQNVLETLDAAKGLDAASMQAVNRKVQNMLHMIGTVRVQDVLDGVIDSLPSLAKELSKEPPEIVINDGGIVLHTQIADLLKNVFMHLYRNSVDHGLEKADDRVAKGKPAAGRIELEMSLADERLWLRLRDDGRGLALGALRKKGLEKGLLTEQDQQRSPEEIAQLIFAPGFSTAAAITEVSGRGVGMDAVKEFVLREGGTIELRFLDQDVNAEYRVFETAISLPGKFALQVMGAAA